MSKKISNKEITIVDEVFCWDGVNERNDELAKALTAGRRAGKSGSEAMASVRKLLASDDDAVA